MGRGRLNPDCLPSIRQQTLFFMIFAQKSLLHGSGGWRAGMAEVAGMLPASQQGRVPAYSPTIRRLRSVRSGVRGTPARGGVGLLSSDIPSPAQAVPARYPGRG